MASVFPRMIVDPKDFSLTFCSRPETNMELYSAALKSFSLRNSRFSNKVTAISHERTGVWNWDFFHVIVVSKCLSLISCSRLETNMDLYSAVFMSFFYRNSCYT